jgi:hypothetical protein
MRPPQGPKGAGRRSSERGAPAQDDAAVVREDATSNGSTGAAEAARRSVVTLAPAGAVPAEVSGFDEETRRQALKRLRSGG